MDALPNAVVDAAPSRKTLLFVGVWPGLPPLDMLSVVGAPPANQVQPT